MAVVAHSFVESNYAFPAWAPRRMKGQELTYFCFGESMRAQKVPHLQRLIAKLSYGRDRHPVGPVHLEPQR